MTIRKLAPTVAALALLAVPTVAQAKDRDSDGLPDRWESRHGLSTSSDSANKDPDRDRVDNANEYREGTRPRDRDSDNDGRSDGREDRDRDRLTNAGEDATGNDPKDRDTDNDGIPDGQEQAGVVSAYENGVLTIELATGGTVTGRVTEDTDVDCASEAAAQEQSGQTSAKLSRRGGSGPSADSGPGGRGFGCDGDREGRDERECPEGTLTVGARIHEATLSATSDGAVWEEIEVLT